MTDTVKHIDNGGSAFPAVCPMDFQFANEGMTLRDWFAGQAMHFVLESILIDDMKRGAEVAYLAADAMIAVRKAEGR